MPASERSRPGVDGELGRTPSGDESHAPTLPGFRNNGSEIPGEMSGRRIRPDATVRGIGPDTSIAYTMDVRNSEVDIVSDLDLQKAWMPQSYRGVWAVGLAGMLLVAGVLFALTRKPSVADKAPPQELGAVEEVVAAPKLELPAPEPEVVAPAAAPTDKAEPKKLAKAPAKVKPKLALRGKTKGKAKAGKKKKAVRASMSASLR